MAALCSGAQALSIQQPQFVEPQCGICIGIEHGSPSPKKPCPNVLRRPRRDACLIRDVMYQGSVGRHSTGIRGSRQTKATSQEAAGCKVNVPLATVSNEDKPCLRMKSLEGIEFLGLPLTHRSMAFPARDSRLKHCAKVTSKNSSLNDASFEEVAASLCLVDLRASSQKGQLTTESFEKWPCSRDGAWRELWPTVAKVTDPKGHIDVAENVQPLFCQGCFISKMRQEACAEAGLRDHAVHQAQHVNAIARGAYQAFELKQVWSRESVNNIKNKLLCLGRKLACITLQPFHQCSSQASTGNDAEAWEDCCKGRNQRVFQLARNS
mmetsp:Transcript_102011/g.297531  ORF Transcript_102011/g.297531 Transcript_102011/m.297531 type:complete len:323 (+) Transcript_102011:390-1358(+)